MSVVALVVASSGAAAVSGQVPFRATANVVFVDVAVFSGTTPVPALRASDFVVHDNGVPQTAVLLDVDSVPLDLTLLLDVGGVNSTGPMRYWSHVAMVPTLLRPGDRLGLTTFARQVVVQFPLTPTALVVPPPAAPAGGDPRLFDAISAEVVRRATPGRRRVVLLVTNGVDLLSVTDPRMVLEMGRKSDGVFYCVAETRGLGQTHPVVLDICSATGGGRIRESGLADGVASLLKSLRAGYLLAFVPQGDIEDGWHNISVTVPGRPSLEVQHRRGYFR